MQPEQIYAWIKLNILSFILSGCTYEGLANLREDLDALKHRVHAREEVRINVASAPPVTKLAGADEAHIVVGIPECPPAKITEIKRVKHVHKTRKKRR